MTDFLEIIIAAGKSKSSWIDLLIPIVFFLIYGISKLIRSMAEKNEEQQYEERSANRPAQPKRYKPIEDKQQSQRPTRTFEQDTARPAQRPQPKKPTGQTRRAMNLPYNLQKTMYQQLPKKIKRKTERVAKPIPAREPALPLKVQVPEKEKPTVSKTQPAPKLRIDLTEKNNLRKAIIYSEILAKPLALRDQ